MKSSVIGRLAGRRVRLNRQKDNSVFPYDFLKKYNGVGEPYLRRAVLCAFRDYSTFRDYSK
jgi:hypothetical protein